MRPLRRSSPMILRLPLAIFAAFAVAAWSCASAAAEPRVELEVVTEEALLGSDARSWTEMLTQAGFSSVRLRGAGNEAPQPKVSSSGTGYRVTGALTSAGQLHVPGGRFRLGDRSGLASWLHKLREGGEDAVTIKAVAFGLLPADLIKVQEALALPVTDSTLAKPPREVAKAIADRLPLKFIANGTSQQILASGEPVGDELQGLASGTALAAVLRPLGLVVFPEKQSMQLRLRISNATAAKEYWPVGWAPKSNPSQTIPELFKFLTVEVQETPLAEAIDAIQARVNTPVLMDHNALAREKVNLQMKVSLPRASTYYGRALDRLLFQAKLKFEIRLDEANKPFLWITTLKQ